METFGRSASSSALAATSHKVDRAPKAGALALGASVEITTVPGYLPLCQDDRLMQTFRRNAERVVGADNVKVTGHRSGGTDMGDLGHVIPVLHPFSTGATGVMHGADFRVVDEELAVLNPARALAMTVVDLLADDARLARQVVPEYRAPLTRAEYLKFVRGMANVETFDGGI